MTKIGLAFLDKTGHKSLDLCEGEDWRVYAFHPSHGRENVSVLFSPQRRACVLKYGDPLDWMLLDARDFADGKALDMIMLPARRNGKSFLQKVIAAGLIDEKTVIMQGNKPL